MPLFPHSAKHHQRAIIIAGLPPSGQSTLVLKGHCRWLF